LEITEKPVRKQLQGSKMRNYERYLPDDLGSEIRE
jgi:hypothetical protein